MAQWCNQPAKYTDKDNFIFALSLQLTKQKRLLTSRISCTKHLTVDLSSRIAANTKCQIAILTSLIRSR
jgi:hypothetical protein